MIRETKKIPSEVYDVRSTALYAALLTLLTWFTPLTWFTLLTRFTLLTLLTMSYPLDCYNCHEYSSYST